MNQINNVIQVRVLNDQKHLKNINKLPKGLLDVFGKLLNVFPDAIDSKKPIGSLQIDDDIFIMHEYYKKKYRLAARVVLTPDDVDHELARGQKMPLSNSSVELSVILNKPKKSNPGSSNDSQLAVTIIDESDENYVDYSVEDMIELAKKNKFPKKRLKINDRIYDYTPVLHFFECANVHIAVESILFKCKICGSEIKSEIGRWTNLNKHIKRSHNTLEDTEKWYEKYRRAHPSKLETLHIRMDPYLVLLAKFFISCNHALNDLNNTYLKELISKASGIKMPGVYSFRNTILPTIMEQLEDLIEERLKDASFVCLIVDMWSNPLLKEYIAVAVSSMQNNFNREIFILGMNRIMERPTAEELSVQIENIVNKFEFNKASILAFASDEGSNFIRLFGNNDEESLYKILSEHNNSEVADDDDNDEDLRVDHVMAEVHNEVKLITTSVQDLRIALDIKEAERLEELTAAEIEKESVWETDAHESSSHMARCENSADSRLDFDTEFLKPSHYISKLELNIGNNSILRISCANHKLNLVLRKSIKDHIHLQYYISKLTKFVTQIRNKIEINKYFLQKECRLRSENETRWTSTYLMLESIVRADRQNVFEEQEIELPVPIAIINIYLDILRPLYRCSIGFQDNESTISRVVPALARLISMYKNFNTTTQGKMLCNLIVQNIQKKFAFELSSSMYLAAAALRVTSLTTWNDLPDCAVYFTKSLVAIPEVYVDLFASKLTFDTEISANSKTNREAKKQEVKAQTKISDDVLDDIFKSSTQIERVNLARESAIQRQRAAVVQEVENYFSHVREESFRSSCKQGLVNGDFWRSKVMTWPKLTRLALALETIPASSAFIERYFSICGVINDKRSLNINDDLFIERSMLKSNMWILDADKI